MVSNLWSADWYQSSGHLVLGRTERIHTSHVWCINNIPAGRGSTAGGDGGFTASIFNILIFVRWGLLQPVDQTWMTRFRCHCLPIHPRWDYLVGEKQGLHTDCIISEFLFNLCWLYNMIFCPPHFQKRLGTAAPKDGFRQSLLISCWHRDKAITDPSKQDWA